MGHRRALHLHRYTKDAKPGQSYGAASSLHSGHISLQITATTNTACLLTMGGTRPDAFEPYLLAAANQELAANQAPAANALSPFQSDPALAAAAQT